MKPLTDKELERALKIAREEWSEDDLARRAFEELAASRSSSLGEGDAEGIDGLVDDLITHARAAGLEIHPEVDFRVESRARAALLSAFRALRARAEAAESALAASRGPAVVDRLVNLVRLYRGEEDLDALRVEFEAALSSPGDGATKGGTKP